MQVDIFTANLIVIPEHLGSHWALAIVDNQRCKVEYYDSLQYNGLPQANDVCLRLITQWN